MLGSVSQDRASLRHELLDGESALLRSGGATTEGWGMAVYPHGDGEQPKCTRCPDGAACTDELADQRGRILMAHVRSATQGELTDANTHPFCLGEYAFCHSGDLSRHESLLGLADGAGPRGETDSERLFHRLLREVDVGSAPEIVVDGLRRAVAAAATCGPLTALNFLFADGEHLYAYRLGAYELHWLSREGQVLVASERITDEQWHDVRQDVLLVLSPGDDEPHAERLLGDDAVANIEFAEPQGSGAAAAARE